MYNDLFSISFVVLSTGHIIVYHLSTISNDLYTRCCHCMLTANLYTITLYV